MKKVTILTYLLVAFGCAKAQNITAENYIDMYKGIAITEMKRSGIPASVTLAQGLLETQNGNCDLVKRSNNHFGIKCKKNWTGESVTHTDDAPNECFRKYTKAEESFKDHSDYLKNTSRYASLFQLDFSDYKGWAYGLKKAGYATNPKYPQILISNIEKYNLQQYDNAALKDMPDQEAVDNAQAGKTNFNDLKAIFILKGTPMLAIALKANIPLNKLLECNDLANDIPISSDQWIYLEPKSKQGNRDSYTALQTETLYEISQNNGVQLKALLQYNGMNQNNTIKKGTKIRLRPESQLSFSK